MLSHCLNQLKSVEIIMCGEGPERSLQSLEGVVGKCFSGVGCEDLG